MKIFVGQEFRRFARYLLLYFLVVLEIKMVLSHFENPEMFGFERFLDLVISAIGALPAGCAVAIIIVNRLESSSEIL